MTSREIVQRLIDEKLINGEEAFTLINDICKNEIYDVWKTLEDTKNNGLTWGYVYPNTTTSTPTWTSASTITTDPSNYTVTASTGKSINCGGR